MRVLGCGGVDFVEDGALRGVEDQDEHEEVLSRGATYGAVRWR